MRYLVASSFWRNLLGGSFLALLLAGTGCGLTKPGSASFASVTIKNHSADEIIHVTTQVFEADGYLGSFDGSQMVFQKEGSRANNLAYEGIVATQSGAQTAIRVKAQVVPLNAGAHRLQCQAYMIRDAGQGFFEEEQRLTNIRSRPYQTLLDRVVEQMK